MSEAEAALAALQAFGSDPAMIRSRIGVLENTVEGLDGESAYVAAEEAGATGSLLAGALLVKQLSGQVNVVIHAVGILQALPFVLAPEEKVIAVSLGAGSGHKDWDLETDRQIAEFKFIRWRGNDSIRQNTLFVDVFHLAEATTDRRRVVYLTGTELPLRFLNGRRKISSVLEKHGADAERFQALHGSRYQTVGDYWSDVRKFVEIVDLVEATSLDWGLQS
ncbi:MAG: hypothetical protein AAGA59_08185 [Actinomycetota bacterium]